LSGKITDKISDIFRIYTPNYPGLSYVAGAMIKTISDEKQLFEELNAFFLAAEKRFFSDEIRTIEEINHVDPLTWENLPPELRLEDLSMDRLQRLWDIAATHNDVTTDDLIDIIKEHEPVCATCPFP
jgi:hypothetical protein